MGAMAHPGYQLALIGVALASPPEQRLLLQVEVPDAYRHVVVTAEMERMGQTHAVDLVDDGSVEADIPNDGIWVGWQSGPYQRHTPVRLYADSGDGPHEIYATLEKTDISGVVRVGWELVPQGPDLTARRNAAVRPGAMPTSDRGLPLVVAFGWGALALLYVGGLVVLAKRDP